VDGDVAQLLAQTRKLMSDKVVGFDLSSRKLAMVSISDGEFAKEVWEVPKAMKDRGEILSHFVEPLSSFFRGESEGRKLWVFVEQPLVGRGGAHATIVQAQVQGLVLAFAVVCGAAGVYPVNVQTWKKVVVGNGRADKGAVRGWLAEHHPVLSGMAGDDQDLVDAACIALYGCGVIAHGDQLKSVQLDP
jgi:hypothetical protein